MRKVHVPQIITGLVIIAVHSVAGDGVRHHPALCQRVIIRSLKELLVWPRISYDIRAMLRQLGAQRAAFISRQPHAAFAGQADLPGQSSQTQYSPLCGSEAPADAPKSSDFQILPTPPTRRAQTESSAVDVSRATKSAPVQLQPCCLKRRRPRRYRSCRPSPPAQSRDDPGALSAESPLALSASLPAQNSHHVPGLIAGHLLISLQSHKNLAPAAATASSPFAESCHHPRPEPAQNSGRCDAANRAARCSSRVALPRPCSSSEARKFISA